MLGMDTTSAETANVAYLKRVDPEIEEVLATSAQVCLYYMTVETQQWMRKNVEGSLFLLKRRSAPRFQLLVLNKMTTDNYTEEVHAGLDFECNPPYLMYTHGNAEILGVWFYERADLDKVESVLKRIKAALPQAPSAAPPAPAASSLASTSAPARRQGGDDAFFDKPALSNEAAMAAMQRKQAILVVKQQALPSQASAPQSSAKALAAAQAHASLAQMHSGPVQAPAAPQVAHGNPLNALFKNAAAKQAQVGPAGPVLLTPSFFSGAGGPVGQSSVAVSVPAAMRAPMAAEAPAGDAPGNSLTKLFAKAGTQPQTAVVAGNGMFAAGGAGDAAGDREKVKSLLARISTNTPLLDMLAGEMRAVGLL